MKYIKIYEQFIDTEDDPWKEDLDPLAYLGLKNYIITDLDEQIESSIKNWPSLYDKKYGREKVLYHMFFCYGTEYEWNDHGELVNVYQTERDVYEYRLKHWEREKDDITKKIDEIRINIENLSDSPRLLDYYKIRLEEYENILKDPFYVRFPQEEVPLKLERVNFSKNHSPIFNIPKNVSYQYLMGGIEILEYVINNAETKERELENLRYDLKRRFGV